MKYLYHPHSHVKIWLSKDPTIFMNVENQKRLLETRENTPNDKIYFIYDSSLLNPSALADLNAFCKENDITPIDADTFRQNLILEDEITLYTFYKDEITHLNEGGNLAVASDILRWLSPSYRLGTYTDLDVPLETSTLPEGVVVDAPLLLNVGSLRLGGKEVIIALNEYLAVIDEAEARPIIERVQKGLIQKLSTYETDYIQKAEMAFGGDGFVNRTLFGYMKNRSESTYITKSAHIHPPGVPKTSRQLRADIQSIMTDRDKYLDFNKQSPNEPHSSIINRLRTGLKSQLSFIKWLFFRKEYREISHFLGQTDDQLIAYLMEKERSLYLKSIVICTTGPIEVARSVFGDYVISHKTASEQAVPVAFASYGLHKAFKSNNVIPMHQNVLGMLKFLGANVGELNDSSWLEEGVHLQKKREKQLAIKQNYFALTWTDRLTTSKQAAEAHLKTLEQEQTSFFWGRFQIQRREAKIKALHLVLACFHEDPDLFDIAQFKQALKIIYNEKSFVFAGLFRNQTKHIIDHLTQLSHDAVVYRVANDKKIPLSRAKTLDVSAESQGGSIALQMPAMNHIIRESADEHNIPVPQTRLRKLLKDPRFFSSYDEPCKTCDDSPLPTQQVTP